MLPLFISEFVGTALLISIGLSCVILNWGEGSVVAKLIPDEATRRALTGFLFGTTGCIITISKVGKISGAHINPAVSFAFWYIKRMSTKAMVGYIISQMAGAAIGSIPLLLWKQQGFSIHYGNTEPGEGGIIRAFTGEVFTTAALITVIFTFNSFKQLRNYTPYTMPFLYCYMVWGESPSSGCSTNPARSFDPALISGVYTQFWIYCLAPITAALIVVLIFKVTFRQYYRLRSGRVSHHNHHTHKSLLNW